MGGLAVARHGADAIAPPTARGLANLALPAADMIKSRVVPPAEQDLRLVRRGLYQLPTGRYSFGTLMGVCSWLVRVYSH